METVAEKARMANGKEQRAKSKEQRAKSEEQRAKSGSKPKQRIKRFAPCASRFASLTGGKDV
jgi:hypothetical protein